MAKEKGEKLACLTAYDYPTARIVDEAGVEIILVGDSIGNVIYGYGNTIPVTLDEVLSAVKAVKRGASRALLVADTRASVDHSSIGNAGGLDAEVEHHFVKELQRSIGLSCARKLRDDRVVHEDVGYDTEVLRLSEEGHRVGRVVSGVFDVEDESTVSVSRRNASLLEDTLTMSVSRLDVACVRQPNDHVILNEEPTRRLPLLRALQGVENDLRRFIHLMDLLDFAETTKRTDQTSQHDRTREDASVGT